MGYTHYWKGKRAATQSEWQDMREFAAALFKDQAAVLAGPDGEGKPVNDPVTIAFNGVAKGGYDHETMALVKRPREFEFCKTAIKPYDTAVVALLVHASNLGYIEWSSDGKAKDHADGIALEAKLSKQLSEATRLN